MSLVAASVSSLEELDLIEKERSETEAAKQPPEESADAAPGSAILFRLIDVIGALALILILLPSLLLIALVSGISSGGSPIFRHRRIGKGGRAFDCLKFRTMYVGAEQKLAEMLASDPVLRAEWNAGFKLKHDPRITLVGRFLRVTSLDELPQLLNVLMGDMSLVGPRPIVEDELPRYGRYVSSYLAIKPGLTGLWQVTGRSDSNYRHRVAADHIYANNKTLLLDLRILFATIPAVLCGRGAC